MNKKTAIVTGANAGLGFATTLGLARQGYRVVMACRNPGKADEAKKALVQQIPEAELSIILLDISDLDSVRQFVEQFTEQFGELDLLINNAGILATPLSRNSAGHEMQMATNYLGNFALVGQLLPHFAKNHPARIVNVGSLSNRFGQLMLDDLNWDHTPYKEMKAYASSKVALLTFTMELHRRLSRSGSNILVLGAHPGFANTEIMHKSPTMSQPGKIKQWFQNLVEPLIPLPADAARPILHAACSDTAASGEYYGPGGLFEIAGKPARAKVNRVALNPDNGQRLWALSETLTGIQYLD